MDKLKLTSILNRWSSCTITLDQADAELQKLCAASDGNVIFIETRGKLTREDREELQANIQTILGEGLRICLLDPDFRLANRQAIRAHMLDVTVAQCKVVSDPYKGLFDVEFNGTPMSRIKRIQITVEPNEPAEVELSLAP